MEERQPDWNPCGENAAVWAVAQVSVQIAPSESEFDPNSDALLAAEELMNILAEDGHPRPGPGWPQLLDEAGSLPLDFAFCLSQMDPSTDPGAKSAARLKSLTHRLHSVADVAVMACVPSERGGAIYELRVPPMTVRAWEAAVAFESRDDLRIPAASVSARAALQRINGGPWLRFTSRESAPLIENPARRQTPPRLASFDFSQTELSDLLETLRRQVRQEAAMRIPYGSTDFSLAERRFLDLVCPEADNIAYRIMRDLQKSGEHGPDEDGNHGGPLPANGSLGPADFVKAFHLPASALEELAANVISRLSDNTLVPTRDQLRSFVLEESAANGVLLEPLQMLWKQNSDIVHCAEEEPLSLLSLVYLSFRGKAGGEGTPLSAENVANLLDGLGFVISGSGSKVSLEDIRTALKRAEALLSDWSQNILDTLAPLPREGALWEDFELTFVDPNRYRQGSLCRIRKIPPPLEQPIRQWWNDNEFSYSLSLWGAADPSRWHAGPPSSGVEGSRAVSAVGWDDDTSRRYLEMVEKTQKTSLRSLRLRLEAQDES